MSDERLGQREQTREEGHHSSAREEEFLCLTREFPEPQRLEDLPEEARRLAENKGLTLLDAYLRHLHEEEKRVREEEERRREAAARSAGSLAAAAVQPHPEQEAFVRAFREALR